MLLKRGDKIIGSLEKGVFKKTIVESKHLLWSMGGVPAIDAFAWDNNKDRVQKITVVSEQRIFEISKERFEATKRKIDFGWGEQYAAPKSEWTILVNSIAEPVGRPLGHASQENLF